MEEKDQKIGNKLKEEKGSVAVLVMITIIAFIIVLTAFYFRSTYVRKAQLETDALLKNVYESQVNDEITQYSWKSYVQEGLRLHYDGINNTGSGHAGDATVWKDLSGNGNDGTLSGINYLEDSGWKTDSLRLDNIDDYVYASNENNAILETKDTHLESDRTIEIVFSNYALREDKKSILAMRGLGFYYLNTYKDGNFESVTMEGPAVRAMLRDHTGSNNYFVAQKAPGIEKLDTKMCLTITSKKNGEALDVEYYLNATSLGKDSGNSIYHENDGDGFWIGKDYGSASSDGSDSSPVNIYSVRVYNRALTVDEVKQNQKIDRQRFQV